jgi:hypothetical protein
MSNTSTHLALPYIVPAQAQKHVTHNEALYILDAIVQLAPVRKYMLHARATSARLISASRPMLRQP